MKPSPLHELAYRAPMTKVILFFKNDKGQYGTLTTTAGYAVNPNQSQRFFPPDNLTAAELGWPVPYWYAEECWGYKVL